MPRILTRSLSACAERKKHPAFRTSGVLRLSRRRLTVRRREESARADLRSDLRREDLFHREAAAATGERDELSSAVRPDRVRCAAVRDKPLVVALLVAVVDAAAR